MSEDIKRAISLAKEGRKDEARSILENIIGAEPHNELAWLWYADTLTNDNERIEVLENCLRFNPACEPAMKGIEILKSKIAEEGVIEEVIEEDQIVDVIDEEPVWDEELEFDDSEVDQEELGEICPNCAESVTENDIICTHCGFELITHKIDHRRPSQVKKPVAQINKTGKILAIIGALAIIVGSVLWWDIPEIEAFKLFNIFDRYIDQIATIGIGLLIFVDSLLSRVKPGKIYSLAGSIFGMITAVIISPRLLQFAEIGVYICLTGAIFVIFGGLFRSQIEEE